MTKPEEQHRSVGDRPWAKILLAVLGVGAAASGALTFVSVNRQTEVVHQPRTTSVEISGSHGGAAIAEAPTAPTVQSGGGNVQQDNSKTFVLFQKAFRAEVLRRSGDLPPAKADMRDRVLDIVSRLLTVLAQQPESTVAIESLSAELAAAIDAAPMSSFQLTMREFTLKPGTAHFLPGGTHVLAFLGPQDPNDPKTIVVKRDGRKATMMVGTVHSYAQQGRDCRLLLHRVAPDFTAATFSFDCPSG